MATAAADHVPEHLVVDLDIYDPSLCAGEDTVQQRVGELAEKGPLVWSTAHGGHWLVTHYDAVQTILQDAETYSSYPNFLEGDNMMGKFIPLEIDPPDHASYRGALKPLFSPKRMMALEDEIRPIVNELLDDFIEDGQCDFVPAFAHALPARVFLALIGLPIEDAPQLSAWVDTALTGAPEGTEEENQQARMGAAVEVAKYLMAAVEPRRNQEPTEGADVITHVVNTKIKFEGEEEERLLNDEELLKLLFLVLIAGLHTTMGALSWGIYHMSQNPEQRQALIDDPSKLNNAVEEILRFEAPVFPGRSATKDVELAGVQLKEGDQIVLALCGANRDAGEFECPHQLDFDRRPNRHVAFGGGRHRCIGAHLARQELRIAFEEIHKRMPDYELDGTPQFHPSQVRGVVTMPIRFTPGQKQS